MATVDFAHPVPLDVYAAGPGGNDWPGYIQGNIGAALTWLETDGTNKPVGAKRLSVGEIQRWDGAAWQTQNLNYLRSAGGSATAPISFALGTALLPSIYFATDVNSGLYSPGADQVAISTNGVQRLSVGPAGNVGLNVAAQAGIALHNSTPLTGSTTVRAYHADATIQSDVTTAVVGFDTALSTAAAAFTLANLIHHRAAQGTIGAGSTVTSQYGFQVPSGMTGATNNFAFWSNLAAATGRWNFYAAGDAPNFMAGPLGIGSTAGAGQSFRVAGNMTGAATVYGESLGGIVQSDATSAFGVRSSIGVAASAFTLPTLTHFCADQGTFGAGSTVTTQFGFRTLSTMTGAAGNYGFYGDLAAAAGRWNIYMNGTADNYFAGNTGIGIAPATRLHVAGGSTTEARIETSGAVASGAAAIVRYADSAGLAAYVGFGGFANGLEINNGRLGFVSISTNNVERFRVTSTGVIQDAAGRELGYRGVPRIDIAGGTLDRTHCGCMVLSSVSPVTVPANVFLAGDTVSVLNASGGVMTLAEGSGMFLYLPGTGTSVRGSRTLAASAIATIWFVHATQSYASGPGVT